MMFHGIVHRDIKPENIMLSAGSAVVADFGIARAVTAAGAGEHLTQTGTIIGTPAYMSPEQATGRADVDGRSDEYSLACVVYEMLVGEPPFTGPTAQAVIARHSLDLVSPPSIVRASIPDAVEAAILRALSKVPADRYTTTALFAEALNTPSPATGAVRRATLERGVARPRLGWRRVVPLVVAVAAAGGYVVVRSLRPARVATGGPDPRRLAVLYFADDSKGHTLGYLADGLTEALIGELRQVPSLTVISRNGVAPYRDPDLPADSVARALKVGTIVRGGVAPAEGAGGRGYQVSGRVLDGAGGGGVGSRVGRAGGAARLDRPPPGTADGRPQGGGARARRGPGPRGAGVASRARIPARARAAGDGPLHQVAAGAVRRSGGASHALDGGTAGSRGSHHHRSVAGKRVQHPQPPVLSDRRRRGRGARRPQGV